MSLLKNIVVLLILFSPVAAAEIQLSNDINSEYNLGELLSYDLEITPEQTASGFLTTTLTCNSYTLNYFTTPISLTQNQEEQVTIPELTLTKNMQGTCSVNINIENSNSETIEETSSREFLVSNEYKLDAFLNKQTFNPGEEIEIYGTVRNSKGNLLDDVPIEISIDNLEENTIVTKDEKYSFKFNLEENIPSFEHPIIIKINHEGNTAEESIEFYVAPIPTKLENNLEKEDYNPNEIFDVEVALYDQANDEIANNALIKIYNSKNKLIEEGYNKISLFLAEDAIPGEYKVESKEGKLKAENTFTVATIEKIKASLDSSNLILTNIGNVKYEDEIRINLNEVAISKEVSIKPTETTTINLEDEITQSGSYEIKVTTKSDVQNLGSLALTYEDSLSKKLFSPITGSFVSIRESLGYAPFFVILISVIIAVMLISYQRKKNIFSFRRQSEKRAGRRYLENIKEKRENPPKVRRRFDIDEREAKSFRDNMLKDVVPKEKNKPNSPRNNENEGYRAVKPKDGDKGLFSMFD
ncbi:hypothetical protein CL617_01310 [archaeon]|nr:hypothetical protein [archaeon]|tara:strand:+ start:1610 stop:3190 length:1581 start_codon:yes stop_codon:yes gene_type:complete